MSLAPTYQQADEPSDLTPGITWLRDNGTSAIRKLDLTWSEQGPWEQPNRGMLLLAGGTMTGPILGNHGLAGLDAPAFTNAPTIDDDEVATKPWTTEQLTNLQTALESLIGGSFSGTTGSISIGNNLAIQIGTETNGNTIGITATYGNGDVAKIEELWGAFPSINALTGYNNQYDGFSTSTYCSITGLAVTCWWHGNGQTMAGTINYLLIFKR